MEPDTFNNLLLLHLLSLCSKGKLSLFLPLPPPPPPFWIILRSGLGVVRKSGKGYWGRRRRREEGDCRVVSVNKRSPWQRSTDSPWLLSPLLLVCWQRMDQGCVGNRRLRVWRMCLFGGGGGGSIKEHESCRFCFWGDPADHLNCPLPQPNLAICKP